MLIINQDRDQAFTFDPASQDRENLKSEPVLFDGVLMGFNLMLYKNLLGTFDDLESIVDEITSILTCESSAYSVTGHSDWEEWEIIKHLMLSEKTTLQYVEIKDREGDEI